MLWYPAATNELNRLSSKDDFGVIGGTWHNLIFNTRLHYEDMLSWMEGLSTIS